MTDWEKYAIIGTAAASAFLLLRSTAKPTPPTYVPTYQPPPQVPQYEPTYQQPQPPPQQQQQPTPQMTPQPPPQQQYEQYPSQPPQPMTPQAAQQYPQPKVIYKKEPVYIEKEIPIPPKLISSPEQKVQQDIDILTERRELLIRLKSLEDQRNKIKDDIINMTVL